MQMVQRLAQLVVDLDMDMFEKHLSLFAFTSVAQGKDTREVEATLPECILTSLFLFQRLVSISCYVSPPNADADADS